MTRKILPYLILFVCLAAGIFYCLYHLSAATSSPREAQLLSVLLTIFSMLASGLASKYYSEFSFNESQRLFALKAAEKVTTLSNELDRLSASLQEELKPSEYAAPNEEILAKDYAIENAIYAIRTLKSMNDGSLSDWQGVIGAEINAKREDQEEREARLQELVDRLESLPVGPMGDRVVRDDDLNETKKLHEQVDSIRSDLRVLASQVSGVPIRHPVTLRARKERVNKNCPACGAEIQYRQRTKPGLVKAVSCAKCGEKLCSKCADGDFEITLRRPVKESISCPKCVSVFSIDLDPVPGTAIQFTCAQCDAPLKITRRSKDIRVVEESPPAGGPPPVAQKEEFLDQVRLAMGPQPWQHGRAKAAAKSLHVSIWNINAAVVELIRRKVFKPQIDGKLYVEERGPAQ